jgi:hypothetical protein
MFFYADYSTHQRFQQVYKYFSSIEFYTNDKNDNKLNKWHTFIGFTLQESFIYKNKQTQKKAVV